MSIVNSKFKSVLKKVLGVTAVVSVVSAVATVALADAADGVTLSSLAANFDTGVGQMATLISDVSLLAGVGFVATSFFKFHQHKLNPQQVPMSQGVTLLLIGAGLIAFPTLLPTASKAVLGQDAGSPTHVGGSDIHNIIGASTT